MSTLIVAECGVNWVAGKQKDNKLRMAKKMLEVFKECGADACKFQMYQDYHVAGHPRAEELKAIIFTPEMVRELLSYAVSIDMEVFWTPMYLEAVDVLEGVGINRYKVRSKDAVNVSLLRKILETGKDVIISVANDRLDWSVLEERDKYRVNLLYCVQRYPAPDKEVHLTTAFPAMRSYQSSVEYAGLSDHTVGITCPIAAVAMGAKIIEKHVKLDDKYDWVDNAVAIGPVEFKEMVRNIRRVEVLRG